MPLSTYQQRQIVKHYVWITCPVLFVLFIKIWYGIRWFRLKTLPSLCTFYLNSWVFYTIYVITETLILITAWRVFTWNYIEYIICQIAICFATWFFLYFHVKKAEIDNRTMNDYRKQALLEKRRRSARRSEDRQLLEAHARTSGRLNEWQQNEMIRSGSID